VPAESMGNDKPWLHCDAAQRFQRESKDRPLTWPPTIQTHNIKELLKKGIPHPSAGPDLWEKWCVRHLPQEGLEVTTELVRYIIQNNYFPEYIKETIMITIFKKGDPTHLENYRGIMLTNTLMTIAISLEAKLLQDWANE
jgi:hypothetical protein